VEVLKVWVGGKPLDRERTYVVVTTEFIAKEQGEKYFGYRPAAVTTLEKGTHAALIEAFKEGPVEAPDRFRIFEEREKKPSGPKPKPAPRGAPSGDDEDDDEAPAPAEPVPVPAGGGGGEERGR
jgi:hypothetical protein